MSQHSHSNQKKHQWQSKWGLANVPENVPFLSSVSALPSLTCFLPQLQKSPWRAPSPTQRKHTLSNSNGIPEKSLSTSAQTPKLSPESFFLSPSLKSNLTFYPISPLTSLSKYLLLVPISLTACSSPKKSLKTGKENSPLKTSPRPAPKSSPFSCSWPLLL